MAPGITDLYSERAGSRADSYFPYPTPTGPIIYNFDQGAPAPELYPLDDLVEYITKAVDRDGVLTCDYYGEAGMGEMIFGYAGLRRTLASRIASRDGREHTAESVMLVNGSAHGLGLAAQAFLGPGDGAVVEALSFPFMLEFIERTGAELERVPVGADGMDVDQLPAALDACGLGAFVRS